MAAPKLDPPPLNSKEIIRFLSKLPCSPSSSGCWDYEGQLDESGYAVIGFNRMGRRHFKGSRLVYWLLKNQWPGAMNCLHKCDNPRCVNPEHLFLGTQRDNVADMVAKDRQARGNCASLRKHPESVCRGSKSSVAKLNEGQVVEMRRQFVNGSTSEELSRTYGISPSHVREIIKRKYWAHV